MSQTPPPSFKGNPEDYRPARGTGTRPPFEPGNKAALKHGGFAPKIRDPLADQIVEAAIEEVPHLSEKRLAAELLAWARAEATVQLIEQYLDRVGMWDADGNPNASVKTFAEWQRLAQKSREQLGLNPLRPPGSTRPSGGTSPR